jgi:hypothetical protein
MPNGHGLSARARAQGLLPSRQFMNGLQQPAQRSRASHATLFNNKLREMRDVERKQANQLDIALLCQHMDGLIIRLKQSTLHASIERKGRYQYDPSVHEACCGIIRACEQRLQAMGVKGCQC